MPLLNLLLEEKILGIIKIYKTHAILLTILLKIKEDTVNTDYSAAHKFSKDFRNISRFLVTPKSLC